MQNSISPIDRIRSSTWGESTCPSIREETASDAGRVEMAITVVGSCNGSTRLICGSYRIRNLGGGRWRPDFHCGVGTACKFLFTSSGSLGNVGGSSRMTPSTGRRGAHIVVDGAHVVGIV